LKKLGILTLVLILTLGIMGTAYSRWSRTLNVINNVSVGTFDPEFGTVKTDDDGSSGNNIDPVKAGLYNGSTWVVERTSTGLDVGQTTSVITTVSNTNDTLTITLGDANHPAYPGYFSTVYCTVINKGNIPIKVSASSPLITVLTEDGRTTDVGVSVSGVLSGERSGIDGGGSVSGYITIGIGTGSNGATTNPPVNGGAYSITFHLLASQFNTP
jgi:hypothetical protein